MENRPKVSIVCATYNHEKYLKYALNSILMQKVNFQYEVLIGEDCSTDQTRSILKKYEKKHPNKFKIFYREKNLGPAKNFEDLYKRTIGKYLIVLETDDFWLSSNKLQIEVDYLDSHPECLAVAHKCIMVNEKNELLGLKYPECDGEYYTLRDFSRELLPGQTTTIMCRNYYLEDVRINTKLCTKEKYRIGPGDKRIAFMLVTQGKIACLNEYLSAYRYVQVGGSSYTANLKKRDIMAGFKERENLINFSKNEINDRYATNIVEYQLVSYIIKSFVKGNLPINYRDGIKIIKSTRHACYNCFKCIFDMMKSVILKPFGKNLTYKKENIKKISDVYYKSDYISVYGDK